MNMKYIKSICRAAWMLLMVTMASCSDDTLNSDELKVYINTGLDNELNIAFQWTPETIPGQQLLTFPVRATRPLLADARVTLVADESMVEAYNEAHQTAYKPLLQGQYRLTPEITIKKGELISGQQVKIELPDMTNLLDDAGFLLPVRMEKVESDDKGLAMSANLNMAYVVVRPLYKGVVESESAPAGTLVDRKGWTVTATAEQTGYGASRMIDNDNKTFWFAYGKPVVTLDMGTGQSINGIRFTPDQTFYGTMFYTTLLEVAVSNDGEKWKELGSVNLTGPNPKMTVENPDYKYIRFYAPENARYLRLRMMEARSNYSCIAELDVYKQK